MWPEIRAQLLRFLGWWLGLHRSLWAVARGRRRHGRMAVVAACLTIDFAIAVLLGAAVALVVSPLVEG